jgi:hypothetical protein
MGDGDYMFAFQQVVMPIAEEFNPDLIISKSIFPYCRLFSNHVQLRPALMPPPAMYWVVVLSRHPVTLT